MMGRFLSRLSHRSRDILFNPALDWHWKQKLSGRVLCVLYHRVGLRGQDHPLGGFAVPAIEPEELRSELLFYRNHGAQFLSLADARSGSLPDGDSWGVIVSFDDGLACNYEAGLKVLDELKIPAVIFQSTAMLSGRPLIWEHILYRIWRDQTLVETLRQQMAETHPSRSIQTLDASDLLSELRDNTPLELLEPVLNSMVPFLGGDGALRELASEIYPTEAQLQHAQANGHEVGSHGHDHLPRHSISQERFEQDLAESHQQLCRILGEPPQAYSYPFNSHLPGDEIVCARYFRQVATVDPGTIGPESSPLALPRQSWAGPHRNRLRRRRWLWTGGL